MLPSDVLLISLPKGGHMTQYSLIEDGSSETGTKTFTVRIDDEVVATNKTKIEAMMEIWTRLDPEMPADLWNEMKRYYRDKIES
jgi:hypothetical protein